MSPRNYHHLLHNITDVTRKALFIAFITFTFFPLSAVNIDGLNYSIDTSTGVATVSGYTSSMAKDLIIPESITYNDLQFSVTSIGSSAFKSCSALTSVAIPKSVTSIGSSAFSYCSALTSVTIPKSVTSIGNSAFYGCSALTSVTIPKSVTSIGNSAFYGCSALTSVTIPNSVTWIGNFAFNGCTSLKELIIEDGTETLSLGYNYSNGKGLFYDCPLESLYLGRNLSYKTNSSYGYSPFYNQTKLTNLTIGNSVTSIGEYAFYGCSALTSVIIPNSVTSIGNSVFYGCSALTSFSIPNSVTSIGDYAFNGCTSLKELTIEDGAETLYLGYNYDSYNSGKGLFYDCPLESLYLGRNLSYRTGSSYGYSPFYNQTKLTNLTIGNSVTSIGAYAFNGCTSLKELTIEDGPETLSLGYNYDSSSYSKGGKGLFYDCPLESLYLGRNLSYQTGSSYGYSPFYNQTKLTNLTIGNSVTNIGVYAFESVNLIEIQSLAITAPTIDFNTFSDYTKLKCHVTVPEEALASYKATWYMFKCFMGETTEANTIIVESPGNLINQIDTDKVLEYTSLKLAGKINGTDLLTLNKFSNITNLDLSEATIVSGGMPYYEKDNEKWGTKDNTLSEKWSYNLNYITWLKLPNNLKTIGSNAFRGKSQLIEITIPDSVTSIGESAFSFCSALTSVTLGNSVTSIGSSAFSFCSALTSVTLGNSVISIGNSAFRGCSALTSVIIPNSVTSIGIYAFDGCSGLEMAEFASVENLCRINFSNSSSNPLSYAHHLYINGEEINNLVIPNSVTSIGNFAFYDCSRLTSVTIPNSVTSIGDYAFSYCSALTSITIPNSVTSVGDCAFNGCTSLKKLIIEDGAETLSLGYNDFGDCLKSLYLGRNLSYDGSSYDDSPFYNQTELTSLTIGNSVTSISSYAFYGCSALTSVTLGNSVISIGNSAFRGCSALTSVSIPDPVTKLLKYTFADCSSLNEITLPGSMREISATTFSNCSNLNIVNVINPIPPVIESSTFRACPSTAELYVPEGSKNIYWIHPYWGQFKTINNMALSDDFTVENLAYHITSEKDATVEISSTTLTGRAGEPAVEELAIPSEVIFNNKTYRVTGIANKGFDGASVTTLYLPETISYVGLEAFKNCSNLTQISCMAILPPSVNSNSFDEETYNTAQLTVAQEAVNAYTEHEVWNKFNSITYSINVESITLDPTNYTMYVNSEFQIKATVLPENATDKTVSWSSSDESVATVSQDGTVTAVDAGDATITATCGEVSASCEVTVLPIVASSITLNMETMTLTVGQSDKLSATVYPENAADKTVTWSSSDESVATVSQDGTVTAVAAGDATITATCGEVSASCEVWVTTPDEPVTRLITPSRYEKKGNGTSCTFVVTMSIADSELERLGYNFAYGYTDNTGSDHIITTSQLRYCHTTAQIYNDIRNDFWVLAFAYNNHGELITSLRRHLDGQVDDFNSETLTDYLSRASTFDPDSWIRPTSRGAIVDIPGIEKSTVYIHTLSGVTVYNKTYEGVNVWEEISNDRFVSSTYIVTIISGEITLSKKIIIR